MTVTGNENRISRTAVATLTELFDARVSLSPEAIAYQDVNPASGEWQSLTWRQMGDRVARWRAGLAGLQLEAGARVAVLLANGSEWVAIDQAALSLGLVVVGLFENDTAASNAALLENSQASVLVVERVDVWQGIERQQPLPELQQILVREPANGTRRVRSVADWLPERGGVIACEVDPDSLAAIVYTSGTTGRPRGAMLSQANLLYNAYACAEAVELGANQQMLSFLPLSHAFERVVGYYRSVITGATVAFCPHRRLLQKSLKQVRPTAFIGVPEVYERYHKELFRRLAARPRITRTIVRFTMDIGWSVFEHRQGRDRWHMRHLVWPLLRATVAANCLRPLGGRLDTAVSGAAALSQPVARTMISLGVNLLQGYGLTEAGPVVSVNRRADNDPQSVGSLLDGVETRLGPDGALWVRSPGVMQGYWQAPESSAYALDANGWLRTGDKVSRLEQKRLYLTGRLKEIIVMTTGEKASPEPLEQELSLDPLVEQVVIVGEARPYLAAIVNCSQTALQAELAAVGLRSVFEKGYRSTRLERAVLKRFSALLRDHPRHMQVRRVEFITESWTVENNLLTVTGKARRRQIARRYHPQIARLYGRGPGPEKTDFSYNVEVG